MRCEQIRDLVMTDYLDGQAGPKTRREIETHLERCALCRRFAQEVKQTASDPFRQVAERTPPDRVWENIKAKLQRGAVPVRGEWIDGIRGIWGWILSPMRLPVLVPVMALVLFFAVTTGTHKAAKFDRAVTSYLLSVGGFGIPESGDQEPEGSDLDAALEEYFI